jgi:RNA polymerase sigma-70 factor (ECF subfamily)
MFSEAEDSLVSRIKGGDQFAVKELFRRYYSGLCRFTYRLVHTREDVEDIVEGVFEKIWLKREMLDPGQSIKSYLFKVAQNQAFDFLKNKGNRHIVLSEWIPSGGHEELKAVSSSDPVQDMTDKDLATAIGKAIEKLPRKCKMVFTLNRQEGLTYSEIADILNISERTVENQIVRALKHLRRDLRDFTR